MSQPPKVYRQAADGRDALLVCPQCNNIAYADADQIAGRVSILCECGYHETHDLREAEAMHN